MDRTLELDKGTLLRGPSEEVRVGGVGVCVGGAVVLIIIITDTQVVIPCFDSGGAKGERVGSLSMVGGGGGGSGGGGGLRRAALEPPAKEPGHGCMWGRCVCVYIYICVCVMCMLMRFLLDSVGSALW